MWQPCEPCVAEAFPGTPGVLSLSKEGVKQAEEDGEASSIVRADFGSAAVSEQAEPSSELDASESRKVAPSLTRACMDGPFAATAET